MDLSYRSADLGIVIGFYVFLKEVNETAFSLEHAQSLNYRDFRGMRDLVIW